MTRAVLARAAALASAIALAACTPTTPGERAAPPSPAAPSAPVDAAPEGHHANVDGAAASSGADGGAVATEPEPTHAAPCPAEAKPRSDGGALAAPTIDARTIEGYVMSRHVSEDAPPRVDAVVSRIAAGPLRDGMAVSLVSLRDRGGATHTFDLSFPVALPFPLRAGDAVRGSIRHVGGGPNSRTDLVLHAADGSLLLSINSEPPGWTITRGRAGARTPSNGYDERAYGVVFERLGARIAVGPGRWGCLVEGSRTYYLWGSAAERTLHRGKPAMPDYVGGWLDSAIVRLR